MYRPTRMQQRDSRQRQGFSLIEMMIVIAIISILISLAAAGAFQVIAVQRVSTTESLIKQVDLGLQAQWQAVAQQAGAEPIADQFKYPQFNNAGPKPVQLSYGLVGMANNPQGTANNVEARARVIWKKLRLVQQFPMTFIEAATPIAVILGPGNIPYFVTPPLQPAYLGKLRGATSPPRTEWENSALLLLALTQPRSGTARFSPDVLPASAVVNAQASAGLSAIVDAWNVPLIFARFPIDQTDLTSQNPAAAGSIQASLQDPLDPQGLLMDPTWNNPTSYQVKGGVWAFEYLCHSVHQIASNNRWIQVSYYSYPVVASAGKNKEFGLTPTFGISNSAQANDNIYSYRLRPGSRGD